LLSIKAFRNGILINNKEFKSYLNNNDYNKAIEILTSIKNGIIPDEYYLMGCRKLDIIYNNKESYHPDKYLNDSFIFFSKKKKIKIYRK
jgi:hypothetical protein